MAGPRFISPHFSGILNVASALLDRGADVNARSTNAMKNTPLHAAAAGSQVELVRLLLDRGADANSPQEAGWTALHSAAQSGNREMVEVLLAHGAHINTRAQNNQAALDLALTNGRQDVARLLEEPRRKTAIVRMMLDGQLEELRRATLAGFASAVSVEELEEARVEALGRKGTLAQITRNFGKLPPEERARLGKLLNSVKDDLESEYDEKKRRFEHADLASRLAKEWIDVTLPAPGVRPGSLHPITQLQNEIEDLFTSLGFAVLDGPEVETEEHNFDALNIPPTHPARDMQDTFWLSTGHLLRTHTSPVQIRAYEEVWPAATHDCPRACVPKRGGRCLARTHVLSARRNDGGSRSFRRKPDLLHEDSAQLDLQTRYRRAPSARLLPVRRTRLRARYPLPDL